VVAIGPAAAHLPVGTRVAIQPVEFCGSCAQCLAGRRHICENMSVLKGMVEKVGHEAWWLHHCPGPWDMAAQVRGVVNLSLDIYDRPGFVLDLMRICTDWLKGFYRRLGERGTQFLEEMIDTGPDALETITSKATSGDFDLADVKQRVGQRVCLFGGFNEHILKSDDSEAVKEEVKRCLDAAAAGGGYILRTTGQIFHAEPGMIELMCQTARDYGRYN
jgi:uroporphyrinogen-III decarboxylase